MSISNKTIIIKLLKLFVKGTCILFLLGTAGFILMWFLFPFPKDRLDKWPASPLISDVKNRPLLSIVGSDDQWRYPVNISEISPWLQMATVAIEDERFYSHFGVDPLAAVRAAGQNIAAMRIVSGASTLNMQLCRMMHERPRSVKAKVIESFRAIQLDNLMDKTSILELYLNVAPYGGNIRGIEAASLKYFGIHAKDLTLGQAALLAGLTKSPEKFRPDRNLLNSIKRRDTVLNKMFELALITKSQLLQAQSGHLEINNNFTVREAYHAAWYALNCRPEGGRTTINLDIQKQVEQLAQEHLQQLPEESEISIVVIDIAESAIISLVGSGNLTDPEDGQVNGVLAKRSPGSVLKPFIYAAAFDSGRLNGDSTVYDIPIYRDGWSPSNFDQSFAGQVSAAEALRRSLNIPAILISETIGLSKCYGILRSAGINVSPDAQRRSGLALAVGGIEASLLDITNAYATLGRDGIRKNPRIFTDQPSEGSQELKPNVCRLVSDILSSRMRCPVGMETNLNAEIPWFMWKTGTSSGRRDAWAVGHNRRYTIGVWVGRFSGTGRVNYIGAEAAEPLLAKLFSMPVFESVSEPPPSEPIIVHNPVPPPRELSQELKIISPASGDTFICYNGSAVICASANRSGGISWFLNGKLIENNLVARLTLSAGRYELNCIDESGKSSKVAFAVVAPGISYVR